MKRGYTCIDSFCGAGGLALGLQRAGLEVLVSFDASECAVETFRRNLSERCLNAKAEDLTGAKLFKEAGFKRGGIQRSARPVRRWAALPGVLETEAGRPPR